MGRRRALRAVGPCRKRNTACSHSIPANACRIIGLILTDTGGSHRLIERVGLASTLIDDLIELSAEGIARRSERLFGTPNATPYVKDGINNCVVGGRQDAVNPSQTGTKAAAHYQVDVSAGTTSVIRLRLSGAGLLAPRHRAWPATRT